jgi:hypothetical protein
MSKEPVYLYRPFVATDKNGTQLLVSVFIAGPGPDGVQPVIVELAKREDNWDTWSAPLKFEETT